MKIVIDIPDELAPAVLKIVENKSEPDDDGRSDAYIMHDLGLSVDDYVRASHIAESFASKIESEIDKIGREKRT